MEAYKEELEYHTKDHLKKIFQKAGNMLRFMFQQYYFNDFHPNNNY